MRHMSSHESKRGRPVSAIRKQRNCMTAGYEQYFLVRFTPGLCVKCRDLVKEGKVQNLALSEVNAQDLRTQH